MCVEFLFHLFLFDPSYHPSSCSPPPVNLVHVLCPPSFSPWHASFLLLDSFTLSFLLFRSTSFFLCFLPLINCSPSVIPASLLFVAFQCSSVFPLIWSALFVLLLPTRLPLLFLLLLLLVLRSLSFPVIFKASRLLAFTSFSLLLVPLFDSMLAFLSFFPWWGLAPLLLVLWQRL